jgi:CheY-like chemotaxis protein
MDKLRVLIAEDHEALRATIVDLLDSEFTVVGAVGDGQQLVEAAPALNPNLIVSDVDMPLMDGFSAMRILRAKSIQAPFVFITLMTVEGISSGIEDHPVGFVHKADLASELKSALHAVAVGVSYLSRSFRQNHENH